jgi:glucokinase
VAEAVRTTAGVDIGGTRIKAVLRRGEDVVARHLEPTPTDVADTMGPAVAGVLDRLVASAPGAPPPERVGLVVPGLVDEAGGHGVWSANLGWNDLDLRGTVGRHVAAEVVVGHDVRAGLLAEHLLGAARGVDDVLFVPLGTGLAVALMTGGRVVRGSTWTGELGHLRVQPDGPVCGCGRRGCLEAVAGATAVGRRWREAGRTGDASDVAAGVATGDPVATAVWAEAVRYLAGALAPVVASAGTRLVVVGGGMAEAGETLLDPLRRALAELLPDPEGVAVVKAGLGEWAGAIGASHLEPTPVRDTVSVAVPDLP